MKTRRRSQQVVVPDPRCCNRPMAYMSLIARHVCGTCGKKV